MRRILGYIFAIFILVFLLPSLSYAQDTEYISLFRSDIELKQNTDIYIQEEIHYHFPLAKHGIYRSIPINYEVSKFFTRPTQFVLEDLYYYKKDAPNLKYWEYEKSKSTGYVDLKIGDPDITIVGDYIYVIKYTIKNYVNYFDDHDELYWNATGNEWEVPILKAEISIKAPGKITDKICYTGYSGETESDCTFSDTTESEVRLATNSELYASEGLTFAISMPKGTLANIQGNLLFWTILANIGLLLPIPIIIIGIYFINKSGKNKKLTIIPHYDVPKGVFPLLAGNIYNKSLNAKHITAQLIQLAIDHHIKIVQESERSYILQKDNKEKDIKEKSIQILYDGIFSNKDSINTRDISTTFYITVKTVKDLLESKLYEDNYYSKKRKKLWDIFFALGCLGIMLFFFLAPQLANISASSWTYGIVLSTIALFILSSRIDIKDTLGNEIYYELQGLKMYINTAEKHRIEFHNDPKKYKGVFEKLLPYAIIFGLEKKWVEEFEDIYKEPPSWYEGDISTFHTAMLINSFSSVQRNVASHYSPPSSHGASGGSGFSGGSSGGGGGGGGGGSW